VAQTNPQHQAAPFSPQPAPRQAISLGDVAAIEEKPVNSFLSGKEKEDWARTARPFMVTAVEFDADNTYGPQWAYALDDQTQPRRLGLGNNARRKAQAEAMRRKLAESPGAGIGPLYLAWVALPGGHGTWTFAENPGVGQDEIPFG